MSASVPRVPAKNFANPPNPCATVVARDGRSASGVRVPLTRSNLSAWAPCPADRPDRIREVLLQDRDLRLQRQTDVGQRGRPRAFPRGRGATPVRIQADRFWYIRPRVPSIGSTMTTISASRSSIPDGSRRRPSWPSPSAMSRHGHSAASAREPVEQHPLRDAIDGVDLVARLLPRRGGHLVGRRLRARGDDLVADVGMNLAKARQQARLVTHLSHSADFMRSTAAGSSDARRCCAHDVRTAQSVRVVRAAVVPAARGIAFGTPHARAGRP